MKMSTSRGIGGQKSDSKRPLSAGANVRAGLGTPSISSSIKTGESFEVVGGSTSSQRQRHSLRDPSTGRFTTREKLTVNPSSTSKELVFKSSRPNSRASSVVSLKDAPDTKSSITGAQRFQLSPNTDVENKNDEQEDPFEDFEALQQDVELSKDIEEILGEIQTPELESLTATHPGATIAQSEKHEPEHKSLEEPSKESGAGVLPARF